jgi:hypothetical protein
MRRSADGACCCCCRLVCLGWAAVQRPLLGIATRGDHVGMSMMGVPITELWGWGEKKPLQVESSRHWKLTVAQVLKRASLFCRFLLRRYLVRISLGKLAVLIDFFRCLIQYLQVTVTGHDHCFRTAPLHHSLLILRFEPDMQQSAAGVGH